MENNIGIYMWTNVHNNKKYIGQSVDLKSRRYTFICFDHQYGGDLIDKARRKYNNVEDWHYDVLEYCDIDELDVKECYYIALYNSNNVGYNLDSGGNLNKKHSEATKSKISNTLKGHTVTKETKLKTSKAVYQYTLNGEFVKRYDSMADAEREIQHNGAHSAISAACRGKRKSVYGYKWKYF